MDVVAHGFEHGFEQKRLSSKSTNDGDQLQQMDL